MKPVSYFFLLVITTLLFAQTDKELVEASVNQPTIKSHIGFLASDVMRGRDTPSPELDIAAAYIKSRFVEYGVDIPDGMNSYFQEVPMKKLIPPSGGSITIGEESYAFLEDFILMEGENGDLQAPMIFVDYGVEEYKQKNIEGKIVISLCGDGQNQNPQAWFSLSAKKGAKFQELGAVALIELYSSNQIPWNLLTRYFNREQVLLSGESSSSITRVWMNRSKEQVQSLDQKKTGVQIDIEVNKAEYFSTMNVVGVVEGADEALKNEYVVYSAHYDHVGVGQADVEQDSIYNGSRDNAVGTVTVLSAAQNLAKDPTRRSAVFILFTGEEKGLLGSQYYVDNSPVDLDQIVYCFNSDNGGYNDTSLATIIGLTRTTAESMIVEACETFGLHAIEDPAPEQGLFDRSDNVRFAAKGIPAPTFSLGFSAFDEEIAKYYHQPGDEPSTLDYDYLEKFFKAYVLSCRMIGNADEAPFWVKGDKYYDSGVSLYTKEE